MKNLKLISQGLPNRLAGAADKLEKNIMEKQIEYIVDDFVRTLQSMSQVIEYIETLEKIENDKEISDFNKKYHSLAADFQTKQYDGTLTQDEISELRTLASKIQNNSINIELAEKENSIKKILQGSNAAISNEISMDFAKLASPSTCC